RLGELHASTYAFLILQPTDYDDLKNEFLPAAEQAGLEVWAYLVPPSELPTSYPPCQGDYVCWATRIGQLAAAQPALTGMVMDDFLENPSTFTPQAVAAMMAHAHAFAPTLRFYAIGYHEQLAQWLARDFQGAVDGVIFPYRDLDSAAALDGQIEGLCSLWK